MANKLGEGCFGQVFKGYIDTSVGFIKESVVAVKMLKSDATEAEVDNLIQVGFQ